jgi:hypothetical protein
MLRFPRFLIPKSRTLRWGLIALVCGPIVLLGLIALSSMLLRIDLRIDLAMIGFAVAVVVVAVTIWSIVQYRRQPQDSLVVGYNYKLIQPVLPLGRYSFSLEVFYEHEVKGEQRRARQALIELRFKKSDHPEILEWCCAQISGQLARYGEIATERYPRTRILLGPEPTPQELEAHVVAGEAEELSGDPG